MKEFDQRKADLDVGISLSGAFMLVSPLIGYFIAWAVQKIFKTEGISATLLGFSVITLFFMGLILNMSKRSKRDELAIEFKNTIIKPKIKAMYPGVEYYPEKGLPNKTFADSKLISIESTLKVYSSSDLIVGDIHGVSLKACDAEVIPMSSDRALYNTNFCGRFYEFDFFKEFKSNLILLQPGQKKPLLYQEYKEIDYESYDFNIEYKIFSNDSHEAFYIITPHLMERLMELDKMFKDQISFSFNNSKLYIAIDKGQRFLDTSFFTQFDESKVNDMLENLSEIENVIEFLNLDNTIFKKK